MNMPNDKNRIKITGRLLLVLSPLLFISHSYLQAQSSNTPVFTLNYCIETALQNNPEIAAMEWDAEAAKERHQQAFSERLPRLSSRFDYTRNLDEQRILPVRQPGEPAILSRDIFSGDILLNLPLFTGGRLINQVKAAELLHQSALHRLSRSRDELVFNVSSVFFNILAQKHAIESLEFSIGTLEEHVKRIEALAAAQKAANVDRLRTEVRLADIQQQLIREKNLLNIQRQLLTNLLGMERSHGQILLKGDLDIPQDSMVPKSEAALTNALQHREDYLAAKTSLAAHARNVDAAKAGHWPMVSLQAIYGGRRAAGKKTGTGDDFGDIGHVAIGLELPLFEGGRINAKIREEHAAHTAAHERLRKLELQIRLEIETALSYVISAEERVAVTQKTIAQAKESLRIEQQKYNLGKGAIVDVLDAQAALLESETTYYRSLAEYHTAVAQLKLAIGEE